MCAMLSYNLTEIHISNRSVNKELNEPLIKKSQTLPNTKSTNYNVISTNANGIEYIWLL